MSDTRHDTIAETLCSEILRGRYLPGDRLPSERELSARFASNRGSVREAVKKLEQMGLADVLPGGARVRPVEESSLEVIGRLLALDDIPDPDLVDQVLRVLTALMKVATEQALSRASEEELAHTKALVRRLRSDPLDLEDRMQNRLDLARQFMRMSGNLALALIARSLHLQLFSNAPGLSLYAQSSGDAQDQQLERLEAALSSRDAAAAVSTLQSLTEVNRRQIVEALRQARARRGLRSPENQGQRHDA